MSKSKEENKEVKEVKTMGNPATIMMLGQGHWVASCSKCGEKHAEATQRKDLPLEVECECKTVGKAE